MSRFIDLTNQTFGLWTAISTIDRKRWLCVCECGTQRSVGGMHLRSGASRSCGCSRPNGSGGSPAGDSHHTTVAAKLRHGDDYRSCKDYWYRRAASIKQRCDEQNIPFGFVSKQQLANYMESICPTHCPVFGVLLVRGGSGFCKWNVSVDRKVPALGYTEGNLQIMSMQANRMKTDATPEQLRAFAKWVMREYV